MKKFRRGGNFLAVLLFNMLINFEWTIPAWVLLACHFFFNWSIIWFWIALGVWLLNILIWMGIMAGHPTAATLRINRKKTRIRTP